MSKFVNILAKEVLENDYFQELYLKSKSMILDTIVGNEISLFDEKELSDFLRFSDILSNSDFSEAKNISYDSISSIFDFYKSNEIYNLFLEAVLSKLGNFPALDLIGKSNAIPFDRFMEREIKKNKQKVPGEDNLIFSDAQFKIFNDISNYKYYSFSGPTSMGKSFIIKNYIRKILYENKNSVIIVLVPTKALISQYIFEIRNELKKELNLKKCSLTSNSEIKFLEDKPYIFIFTQERLNNFLAKTNLNIDYLFVDEAQNICSYDIRSPILTVAISNTISKNKNVRIYFASPLLNNPENLFSIFQLNNAGYKSITDTMVSQNIYFVDLFKKKKIKFLNRNFNRNLERNINFNDKWDFITSTSDKSNIIYCNSISKTFEFSEDYRHFLNEKKIPYITYIENKEEIDIAINKIEKLVHKECYLIQCLKFGIGYHFASLPLLVREIIEYLFKKGFIKYLFCTSTLLQGVNLPSKNLYILTNKLGKSNLDSLNLWNLIGRAGRLKKELYGNIFCIKDSSSEWGVEYQKKLDSKENIEVNKGTMLDYLLSNYMAPLEYKEVHNEKDEIDNEIVNTIKYELLKQDGSVFNYIDSNFLEVKNSFDNEFSSYNIPSDLLKKNLYINIGSFNSAVKYFQQKKIPKLDFKLEYNRILTLLDIFKTIFDWDKYESDISKGKRLNYYAFLILVWLQEEPLNSIITKAIRRYEEKTDIQVRINRFLYETYDGSKRHKNFIISNIITDINDILGYKLEKYFSAFSNISSYYCKEEERNNWGKYLEYGTTNTKLIKLMDFGFTRHTSKQILVDFEKYIIFDKYEDIEKIHLDKILSYLDKDSIEYQEIKMFHI